MALKIMTKIIIILGTDKYITMEILCYIYKFYQRKITKNSKNKWTLNSYKKYLKIVIHNSI